jgi:hypothetical protein
MPKARVRNLKVHPPLESDVQREGIATLQAFGWLVYRRNVGAMSGTHAGKSWFVKFSEKGQSDTWAIMRCGRHAEIEFKRYGKRPTLDQVLWLRKVNARTGAAFWVDSLAYLWTVAKALSEGAVIQYHDTKWMYGKAEGPSGDYDVVWPERN